MTARLAADRSVGESDETSTKTTIHRPDLKRRENKCRRASVSGGAGSCSDVGVMKITKRTVASLGAPATQNTFFLSVTGGEGRASDIGISTLKISVVWPLCASAIFHRTICRSEFRRPSSCFTHSSVQDHWHWPVAWKETFWYLPNMRVAR